MTKPDEPASGGAPRPERPPTLNPSAVLAGIIQRSNFEHIPEQDEGDKRRSHVRDLVVIGVQTLVILGSFVLVYLLSALFLERGKPEQAEKIVVAVLGILGGIGLGEVRRGFSRRG